MLLDEAALKDKPQLLAPVTSLDGLLVVGKTLTVQRQLDYTVVWYERAEEVEYAMFLHKRLIQCAEQYAKKTNSPPVLTLLEEYRAKAKAKVDAEKARLS